MRVALVGHPEGRSEAEVDVVDPAYPLLLPDESGSTLVYYLYGFSSRGVPIYRHTRTQEPSDYR